MGHAPLLSAALAFTLAGTAFAQGEEPLPPPVAGDEPLAGLGDPLGLGFKKVGYSIAVRGGQLFDDNLFLTSDDEISDRISIVELAARARHEWRSGAATLAYGGRQRWFENHPEFDGMEHTVNGSATQTVGNWRFDPTLEWRALKDPFDVLQSTERVDSRYGRGLLRGTGDFGPFDLELSGAYTRFTVDDDELDRGDYRRTDLSAVGFAEIGPKVSALAELTFWRTRYDEEDFSSFNILRVAVGARGELTPKTRGEARIGYARSDPADGDLSSADAIVASITGTWQVTEAHETTLAVRREPAESLRSGLAIADEIRLGYRYASASRWTVTAETGWDRRHESNGGGVRRGLHARGGFTWAVSETLNADLSVLKRTRSSADEESDFDNFQFSIGLGVQW